MPARQHRESYAHPNRRRLLCLLGMLAAGASANVWAQAAGTTRPALTQLVQAAKLIPHARLWARASTRVATRPDHPLSAAATQVLAASDQDLLTLLGTTLQALTDQDIDGLLAILATPMGHWVVEASLWAREFVFPQGADTTQSTLAAQGIAPRRLSNAEMQTIKAMDDTKPWQALRRVANASLLSSELMAALDWPQFIEMTPYAREV